MAVEVERRAVVRLHGRLGDLVPALGELHREIDRRDPQQIAQFDGVHEADGRAASERGVRARPRVGDCEHTGCDRRAVDHERTMAVLDLRHDRDLVVEGLAVGPVRNERERMPGSHPGFDILHTAQRRVLRARDEAESPRAVVAGKCDRRHRSPRLQDSAHQRRDRTVGRTEMTPVVHEARILELLLRRTRTQRGQHRG